jgi:xylulokinase
MGVILSAAASLEWLSGILGAPAPKLTGALGTKLTGPSPALFLPYLSGERTPVGDAQVRGLIMGLGHETDKKILTHAALDAVAFAFRDSLEALKGAGTEVKRVTAVGGGSKSELWLKIIATVLGVPVDLPAAGDVGGAFGAARLGYHRGDGRRLQQRFSPRPRQHAPSSPRRRHVTLTRITTPAIRKSIPRSRRSIADDPVLFPEGAREVRGSEHHERACVPLV